MRVQFVKEMQDLNLIMEKLEEELALGPQLMARFYKPDDLLVGQAKEILDMLTECLAARFPRNQAVTKAKHIMAEYYFDITEAQSLHEPSVRAPKRLL